MVRLVLLGKITKLKPLKSPHPDEEPEKVEHIIRASPCGSSNLHSTPKKLVKKVVLHSAAQYRTETMFIVSERP